MAATIIFAGPLSPVFGCDYTTSDELIPMVEADLKAGKVEFDTYYRWEGSQTSAQYYINPNTAMAANISAYDECLQAGISDNFTLGNWAPVGSSASAFYGSAAKYISNLPTEVEPKYLVPYEESVNGLGSALNKYGADLMALAPDAAAAAEFGPEGSAANLAPVTFDASI